VAIRFLYNRFGEASMTRKGLAGLFAVAFTAVVAVQADRLQAQMSASQSLGTVRIPKGVTANGQPLAAGTYSVRVSGDSVTPVVGQTSELEQWVEFVQGGQVKGKELATVLTATEVKNVVKGKAPASGASKTELLKGNDYVRVWLNHGGTHYLIHFQTTPTH
jgi:hypothetical protein